MSVVRCLSVYGWFGINLNPLLNSDISGIDSLAGGMTCTVGKFVVGEDTSGGCNCLNNFLDLQADFLDLGLRTSVEVVSVVLEEGSANGGGKG